MINKLTNALVKYGELDSQLYHVNLIGIRHTEDVNKFNDELYILRNTRSGWDLRLVKPFTTDPGKFNLNNPVSSLGCAILKEGFHKALWKLGRHKNSYRALVQATRCTVYRDNDKDDELDLDPMSTSTGIYGINLHRANEKMVSKQVDKWSAGCQVVADPSQFKSLLGLCDTAANNGQVYFSYLLLTTDMI